MRSSGVIGAFVVWHSETQVDIHFANYVDKKLWWGKQKAASHSIKSIIKMFFSRTAVVSALYKELFVLVGDLKNNVRQKQNH